MVASTTLAPDTSQPRCLGVSGEQRIEIVNAMTRSVSVQLGRFSKSVPAQGRVTFDAPVKDYLAKGLHCITTDAYGPGSCLEVWYRPDGW
jgi:hypothetical protein